jgi:hypothetical protein
LNVVTELIKTKRLTTYLHGLHRLKTCNTKATAGSSTSLRMTAF